MIKDVNKKIDEIRSTQRYLWDANGHDIAAVRFCFSQLKDKKRRLVERWEDTMLEIVIQEDELGNILNEIKSEKEEVESAPMR